MREQTHRHRTAEASPKSPVLSMPAVPSSRSGGQALDRHTQAEMSARFGHDFSSVRIHTDSRAEEAAETVGANAYAVGSDIVFGGGKYTPGSPETERLLAHELTHVVQGALHGPGDPSRTSSRADASEREAEALADQATAGRPVRVQAAPQAALARDEEGGWLSGLASSAWSETKAAAGAVYDGYEKETDFKSLQSGSKDPKVAEEVKGHWYESLATGGLNGGIDALEKGAAAGNQKMVDDSKGHWYEGLAEGAAWMNDGVTQATGGLVKGVGDIGFGMANAVAHPIDAAAGLEGIAEHDLPMVGSVLKAGHGIYDLAVNGGGQYGNSTGDLANHLFNPMQQMEDDQKFNTNLATGIIAPDRNPDGTTDWSAWKNKPIEALTRAATNVVPMALGLGEAAAGEGGAEAARATAVPAAPELPPVSEPLPSTLPRPVVPAPDTIPNGPPLKPIRELPPNINPADPRLEPPSVPKPAGVPTEDQPPDTRREVPLPARRTPGAAEPVGDPGNIHERKTGDNPSSLPPSSGPDPNHPFFGPAPEPVTPSIEELLEGLKQRPRDPIPDPLGPLLDE